MRRFIVPLAALLAATASMCHAAPVGLAPVATGKSEVKSGNGAWKTLTPLAPVSAGDAIRVSGGEIQVVFYRSGARYKVIKAATITDSTVKGGSLIKGLGGVSAQFAQKLEGARTGAFLSRNPGVIQPLKNAKLGVLPANGREFSWEPSLVDPKSKTERSYSFTLFDGSNSDVLWHEIVSEPRVLYPTEGVPRLIVSEPYRKSRAYVWRAVELENGIPSLNDRWGAVCLLEQDDLSALKAQADALDEQIKAGDPSDIGLLMMKVELFKQNGAFFAALELLNDMRLLKKPGIQAVKDDCYRKLGVGQLFGRNYVPPAP